MTDTPPDWVLIEAGKQSNYDELDISQLRYEYNRYAYAFRALCDMIQKYEQPTVDRKLLCAREAMARNVKTRDESYYRSGEMDNRPAIQVCLLAIELWEEGFGRD